MSIINRVQLICNLGSKPKVISANQSLDFVCFSAASNERYRHKNEWKTHTEWHNLVAFGKVSEIAKKLKKGDQIFVEGKIRTNKWNDSDGNTRTAINIVVQSINIIGRFPENIVEDNLNNSNIGDECLTQIYESLSNLDSVQ